MADAAGGGGSTSNGTAGGEAAAGTAATGALLASGSLRVRGAGGIRFTDKDEHMYFWFPLLAGLSELTFDPRPEIRCAAARAAMMVAAVAARAAPQHA